MAELEGKVDGCSRGRGRLDAPVRRGYPLLRWQRHRGRRATARRRSGPCRSPAPARQRVTACFFGDGAVAEGEFHESMNLAALWHLPVLFCCENNLYAMGTALAAHRVRDRPLAQGGRATGCRPGRSTAWTWWRWHMLRRRPRGRASRGGPHFLELRTYRFRAHSMYDPDRYRDKAEIETWRHRDPITLLGDAASGVRWARRRCARDDRGGTSPPRSTTPSPLRRPLPSSPSRTSSASSRRCEAER